MRANLEVLEVLEVLDAQGRPADDAERQILPRWSGWGAVPAVDQPRGEPAGVGLDEVDGYGGGGELGEELVRGAATAR